MLQIHPVWRHQNVNFGLGIFTIFPQYCATCMVNTKYNLGVQARSRSSLCSLLYTAVACGPFVSGWSDAQNVPGKKHDHNNEEHQGCSHDSGDYI